MSAYDWFAGDVVPLPHPAGASAILLDGSAAMSILALLLEAQRESAEFEHVIDVKRKLAAAAGNASATYLCARSHENAIATDRYPE